MERPSNKSIKIEILKILNKCSKDPKISYSLGIDELERYILTLKQDFSKIEILDFLNTIFPELNDEYKDEVLGDIVNRIHGFCPLNRDIKW